MKVLVLYGLYDRKIRTTILDHLYSFRRYVNGVDYHYCNVFKKIPRYLSLVEYDGIILHYTLLSAKWKPTDWKRILPGLSLLKQMNSVKIALPQDEYVFSNVLCKFFRDHDIKTVFTCANPIDYQVLYPSKKSGLEHYFTTLTGFVDENTLELLSRLSKKEKIRTIDIGYRARDLPFWLGDFGQIKTRLAQLFLSIKDTVSLNIDISTNDKDVFYGDNWFRFILRCRTMIGCLGGASLHDRDGKIRMKVENYVEMNPNATFEEVEKHCFKGKDNTLHLFALSPRHFECAMAKTCQVLVEGDYQGIFKPGIHFIELKRDFSNLKEVLKKIEDTELCKQIAERAYQDIVASKKYTYRKFAEEVIGHIHKKSQSKTNTAFNNQKFRIVGFFLCIRKLSEHFRRFFFHPKPLYRIIASIIPKKIKKKLKPKLKYLLKSKP